MIGAILVIWVIIVFYATKWWWKKTKGSRLLALYPTLLIAISLVGLLVGSIWLAKSVPGETHTETAQIPAQESKQDNSSGAVNLRRGSNIGHVIMTDNYVRGGSLLNNEGTIGNLTAKGNEVILDGDIPVSVPKAFANLKVPQLKARATKIAAQLRDAEERFTVEERKAQHLPLTDDAYYSFVQKMQDEIKAKYFAEASGVFHALLRAKHIETVSRLLPLFLRNGTTVDETVRRDHRFDLILSLKRSADYLDILVREIS